MVTVTELNRAPDGRFESLEATESITDPSGSTFTSLVSGLSVDRPQDVGSDRSAGVTYQNTTGHPLIVTAYGENSSDSASIIQVSLAIGSSSPDTIDESRLSDANDNDIFGDFTRQSVSGIVPDGDYYEITINVTGTNTNPTENIRGWHEQEVVLQ